MSTLHGDSSLGAGSEEMIIYKRHLDTLKEKLVEYGVNSATRGFYIQTSVSEEERSTAREYLSNHIESNADYKATLEAFLAGAFKGISKHYGRNRETERMKALERLYLSVTNDRGAGETITAASFEMSHDIREQSISDDGGQTFGDWKWHTPVGKVPLTFPTPLSDAVRERGIPTASAAMIDEFSKNLRDYLLVTPGDNSLGTLAFRGLWSTKNWPKVFKKVQSQLTEKVNSALTDVWRKKIDNDLVGKGSLRKIELELIVSPSELVEENVTDGERVASGRRNFDPKSIEYNLCSTDGFFDGVGPPLQGNLMDLVNYNDPEYDRTAESDQEQKPKEESQWRRAPLIL